MQCSVELPIKYLNYSDNLDYNFVIASTCLEHEKYYNYYRMAASRAVPTFTILDNGAFETGEAIDDYKYLEIAKELNPDVLIIPDVYKDPKASLARYTDFMQTWKANPIEDCALMGVIQCDGREDIAHMMGDLYYSNGVEWIGVPYISELNRARFIEQHSEWLNVHILGLPSFPEIFSLHELDNVKSIDSSLPIKVTKDSNDLLEIYSSITTVRPDETALDIDLLKNNLATFKEACNATINSGRLF